MSLFDELDQPEGSADPGRASGPDTVRIRLLVAYDGSGYHGFASQPGVTTVGGSLAGALDKVLRHPVELTCAGRTDAGVHAWGQVVSFDAAAESADLERIVASVNRQLAPAVVVREASVAPDDFDARHSATARCYRYSVLNRPVPDPFLAATTWHVPEPLDLRAMILACDPLIGEHDFSSFCRAPKVSEDRPQPSLVRRVIDARWRDAGDGVLHLELSASAFCHQMVRSITGLLVDVGRGRRRAGEVSGILRARDRQGVGNLAPPHGLCLRAVRYEDADVDPSVSGDAA